MCQHQKFSIWYIFIRFGIFASENHNIRIAIGFEIKI